MQINQDFHEKIYPRLAQKEETKLFLNKLLSHSNFVIFIMNIERAISYALLVYYCILKPPTYLKANFLFDYLTKLQDC